MREAVISWLVRMGGQVVRDASARQIGAACGYVSAEALRRMINAIVGMMWPASHSTSTRDPAALLERRLAPLRWRAVDCRSAADLQVVRDGNQVLGINLGSLEDTTFLTESQVAESFLAHVLPSSRR